MKPAVTPDHSVAAAPLLAVEPTHSYEAPEYPVVISGSRYTVRYAADPSEREAALRLRYHVFNLELGEGLESAHQAQLDEDEFDAQFRHLIVVENQTRQVVGTYRVQTSCDAAKGLGFYSQKEFDLTGIPDSVRIQSIELGRACILASHRNGRVLYLLWKALAKTLLLSDNRYLFGCASFPGTGREVASEAAKHFEAAGHMEDSFSVRVQAPYTLERNIPAEPTPDENASESTPLRIPPLIELYLGLGARICGGPAVDTAFNTTDFLILLDAQKLSTRNRELFFS